MARLRLGCSLLAHDRSKMAISPVKQMALRWLLIAAITRAAHLANESQRQWAERLASSFDARGAAIRTWRSAAPLPRASRPWVFFHQRKAGGSSVRKAVAAAAKRAGLARWIPCFDGVDCATFAAPTEIGALGKATVLGGHLRWPTVVQSLYINATRRPTLDHPRPAFDCYTGFREPVSRVVSCWNYRFRQRGGKLFRGDAWDLAALPLSNASSYLRFGESIYGEGCNNEGLRVLSDAGGGEAVNGLTAGDDLDADGDGWAPGAAAAFRQALARASSCVVGVLERCEETVEVLVAHFPWLAGLSCDLHANNASLHGPPPPPAHAAEIMRLNALDGLLYDVANRQLDAQLAVVRAARGRRRE